MPLECARRISPINAGFSCPHAVKMAYGELGEVGQPSSVSARRVRWVAFTIRTFFSPVRKEREQVNSCQGWVWLASFTF
jgi:hypothetical protein